MSASREKKARQEFNASGAVDPKAAREAQERAKQRRSNWLYGGIAIVFVLVAAALLVWNSNVIQRGSAAVTVEGETYSAAEVSYFYHVAYNSIAQNQYASYYGLSTSTPLTQQSLSDMAKTLLGVSEDMTWDAYFKEAAKKSLIQITMLKKGAAEKGITWNDDMQKELDSTMDTLASYAKSAGKSEGEYLKQLYGSNMTKKIFQGILKDTIIASHYQQDYIDSLTYTDDELQKYYQENKNSFDVANYEMITFNGAAASTKDADGNTVQPTEEESAAALQKAKDSANAALEQVKGGELLVKAAKDYEPIGTYSHPEAGTYSGDAATKWVFDESRQEGDTEIVENGTSIYLLVFHSRTRNDYNTVDVRHILFKVDTTGLDSKAEDYQAKLEELKAGKKQEAENALQAWKDGDATEDSFAKLANELSDDTGSNTNGGLYKQVYKNKMVTGFNDWCFDESRKAGDTGIVENDGNYIGYHVMYFVGTDDPYWMVQVRNAMTNKAYSEWSANLVKDITATENSGMKYVG
ncbi:MAG: peptidylprolyl isomerase [Oscillibacter sp.]|nr:peptidylprolyl isomerase [Oscillibacter sp.]HAZ67050.1 hypothetical protein [Oscillibacter sp.]